MNMFCFQCQETAGNKGCTSRGVCGKQAETARLQDLLIYSLKGLSVWGERAFDLGLVEPSDGRFLCEALFATITNANFDNQRIADLVRESLVCRDAIKARVLDPSGRTSGELPDCASWSAEDMDQMLEKAQSIGVESTANEDIRSLRELLTYGIKGLAAYAHHASVLGFDDEKIWRFAMKGLAATTRDLSADDLTGLVMECGETAVRTMALLDKANTETYGTPEATTVNIGVRGNTAILVSGHDLRDLQELLDQTQGTGVDVYTHGEMLPANAYPFFRKYDNLVGNYGGSWWRQKHEFESFNGPILMTTNCLVPPDDSYRDRVFTTNTVGFPGCSHIPDRKDGKPKDFSAVIEAARKCSPPESLEEGGIPAGYAHAQVLAVADKIVEAVKRGAIKRFVVMAGCDGRHKSRDYYAEVARNLPADTVILTAGCAKYRYNKLDLGEIVVDDNLRIPRVLDAGQCNDSYSLAVIALKLKEAFGLEDINELPVSYDIAWYEQKAVTVLLALLSLGVKGIRLGPTLPAFLSPTVASVLVDRFGIKPVQDASADVQAMMNGK